MRKGMLAALAARLLAGAPALAEDMDAQLRRKRRGPPDGAGVNTGTG